MEKRFVILLILILASSSLIVIKIAQATITKPSVPEFTVKFINASYTVVDPYTGVSQQIDNSSIEVIIKNQAFAYSFNGSTYHLYYNVRTKPHFGGNWTERYPVIDRPNSPYNADSKSWSISKYLTNEFHSPLPSKPNSDYTVISYALNGDNAYYSFYGLPSNAQIDFQVEAIVGHDSQAWYVQHPLYPEYGGFYEPAIAYDTDSGWSNTQTITIDANASTTTPNASPSQNSTSTPEPQQTEPLQSEPFPTLLVVAVAVTVVTVVAVGVLVYFKKRKR